MKSSTLFGVVVLLAWIALFILAIVYMYYSFKNRRYMDGFLELILALFILVFTIVILNVE
jgi:hypothetical protein